jgi:hypothetical protein
MEVENNLNNNVNASGGRQMVGFRCSNELRKLLTGLANENDMNLARYIEQLLQKILMKGGDNSHLNENIPDVLLLQRKINELTDALNQLQEKYDWTENKLRVFNQPKLLELYRQTEGKSWGFVNDDGRRIAHRIEHPADVVNILTHLFKVKPNV